MSHDPHYNLMADAIGYMIAELKNNSDTLDTRRHKLEAIKALFDCCCVRFAEQDDAFDVDKFKRCVSTVAYNEHQKALLNK